MVSETTKKLKAKVILKEAPKIMRDIGPYTPENKDPKKLTTKLMIEQALADLTVKDGKKSASFFAIRKYIVERFHVDVDRINFFLKKSIKNAVESGVIIQTKGIGASGSFKLAPVKSEKTKKVTKKRKNSAKKEVDELDSIEMLLNEAEAESEAKKLKKPSKTAMVSKKSDNKEKTAGKDEKPKKVKKKESKEKVQSEAGDKNKGSTKTKVTKKKRKSLVQKRKSIGSLVKAPKMKPKKAASN